MREHISRPGPWSKFLKDFPEQLKNLDDIFTALLKKAEQAGIQRDYFLEKDLVESEASLRGILNARHLQLSLLLEGQDWKGALFAISEIRLRFKKTQDYLRGMVYWLKEYRKISEDEYQNWRKQIAAIEQREIYSKLEAEVRNKKAQLGYVEKTN